VDRREQKNFITWERFAVTLISILILVIGFAGRGIVVNVEAMRNTMMKLDQTMGDLRVEIGKGQAKDEAIIRRLDRVENKLDGLQR